MGNLSLGNFVLGNFGVEKCCNCSPPPPRGVSTRCYCTDSIMYKSANCTEYLLYNTLSLVIEKMVRTTSVRLALRNCTDTVVCYDKALPGTQFDCMARRALPSGHSCGLEPQMFLIDQILHRRAELGTDAIFSI
jgi:hypothetical protein